MPTNYWDYLQLEQLLSLQGGLPEEETDVSEDELCFIVVHQAYELWFKVVLRELRLARDGLAADPVQEEAVPLVVHHLGRVNEIFRLATDQFRVVETLSPQDFLAFRDKLVPASGFQSFQMREMEVLLGLPDEDRIEYEEATPLEHIRRRAEGSPGGDNAWRHITAAQQETTLHTVLSRWLYRTPIRNSAPGDAGDDEVVRSFLADYLGAAKTHRERMITRMSEVGGADPTAVRRRFDTQAEATRAFLEAEDVPEGGRAERRRVRAALVFIESYREQPLLAWPRALIDAVVQMEELLVIWRSRHARMVERIIGRRVGTGGSSGVDYLDRTASYRIFTDLWAVRTLLLSKDDLPPLEEAANYGFATGN